jgi:hypothetical protein
MSVFVDCEIVASVYAGGTLTVTCQPKAVCTAWGVSCYEEATECGCVQVHKMGGCGAYSALLASVCRVARSSGSCQLTLQSLKGLSCNAVLGGHCMEDCVLLGACLAVP